MSHAYPLSAPLSTLDPEVRSIIQNENQRQEDHIELIASENYTSQAVMEAQGSRLTNKYAEGYPGKRYYGGCEYVDAIESLAIERLKRLFQADYANVQPHSGSQANAAVCLALLNPGDKILGMDLAAGGHLTHGSKVNFSGKLYESHHYGVDPETGLIDYEQVRSLARKCQPRLIIAGFSAYSRIIDWSIFRYIADEIGAYLMIDMAHISGLVAAGLYPNPLPYADVVTSTTHKTLRGPRGGFILARGASNLEKKLKSAVFPGNQGGPLMHVIAAKAVAFHEAFQNNFKIYQQQVLDNAQAMTQQLSTRGIKLVSGGTDNHLFLINLIQKNYSGKAAETALAKANITVNFNAVPNDPRAPFVSSGLRIGTPAMTTRGFKETESRQISDWIADILENLDCNTTIDAIRTAVSELCRRFPVYQ